jgi:hypothetical protein
MAISKKRNNIPVDTVNKTGGNTKPPPPPAIENKLPGPSHSHPPPNPTQNPPPPPPTNSNPMPSLPETMPVSQHLADLASKQPSSAPSSSPASSFPSLPPHPPPPTTSSSSSPTTPLTPIVTMPVEYELYNDDQYDTYDTSGAYPNINIVNIMPNHHKGTHIPDHNHDTPNIRPPPTYSSSGTASASSGSAPASAPPSITSSTCDEARKKFIQMYPDVKEAAMDPWVYYTTRGIQEGKEWPGPECQTLSWSSYPRCTMPFDKSIAGMLKDVIGRWTGLDPNFGYRTCKYVHEDTPNGLPWSEAPTCPKDQVVDRQWLDYDNKTWGHAQMGDYDCQSDHPSHPAPSPQHQCSPPPPPVCSTPQQPSVVSSKQQCVQTTRPPQCSQLADNLGSTVSVDGNVYYSGIENNASKDPCVFYKYLKYPIPYQGFETLPPCSTVAQGFQSDATGRFVALEPDAHTPCAFHNLSTVVQ